MKPNKWLRSAKIYATAFETPESVNGGLHNPFSILISFFMYISSIP